MLGLYCIFVVKKNLVGYFKKHQEARGLHNYASPKDGRKNSNKETLQ